MTYELFMRNPKQAIAVMGSYSDNGSISGFEHKFMNGELQIMLGSEEDYAFIKSKLGGMITRDSGMVSEDIDGEDYNAQPISIPLMPSPLEFKQKAVKEKLDESFSMNKSEFEAMLFANFKNAKPVVTESITKYQLGDSVYLCGMWDESSQMGLILAQKPKITNEEVLNAEEFKLLASVEEFTKSLSVKFDEVVESLQANMNKLIPKNSAEYLAAIKKLAIDKLNKVS